MSLDLSSPRPSTATFDALDGLPVPIIVRARNGRLRFANLCARDRLSLSADVLPAAGLTRLGPPVATGATATFALTIERSIERRVDARCAPFPSGPDDPLELLMLTPVAGADVSEGLAALERRQSSLTHASATLLPATTATLLGASAEGAGVRPPAPTRASVRRHAAEVLRRVRTRARGTVTLETRVSLPRDARETAVDAITTTELVLSACELLTAGAAGGLLELQIRCSEQRLRFALDARRVDGGRLPDLRTQRTLRRSLRPALQRLGATFEIHGGDSSTRRIVVTLPTHAPAGA